MTIIEICSNLMITVGRDPVSVRVVVHIWERYGVLELVVLIKVLVFLQKFMGFRRMISL